LVQYTKIWGMRTISTQNGEEALRMIRVAAEEHDPFDLVLCDLHTGEMNSEGLARQIRKIRQM